MRRVASRNAAACCREDGLCQDHTRASYSAAGAARLRRRKPSGKRDAQPQSPRLDLAATRPVVNRLMNAVEAPAQANSLIDMVQLHSN